MRVVVTSDTHYHPRWNAVLESFVAELAALQPDCLVVAGDIGERVDGYRNMLKLLQAVDCPRLILTGNHDLWARDEADSKQLWTDILPNLTREYGAIWLEDENWVKNGLAICGTNGWYDYSARDPSINWTEEQYATGKAQYMADGRYVRWDWSDIEFSDMLGEAFSARLAALDADPDVREILVVTHVPAFEQGIARIPGNTTWNLTNAYFGNLTLGTRITQSEKVTRVISGHTHVGKSAQIGAIDMHVLWGDYGIPIYVALEYPEMSG